jgi:hypothetical protein
MMMMLLKKFIRFLFLSLVLFIAPLPILGADNTGSDSKNVVQTGVSQKPVFNPMPDPGKKVPIGDGYYLVYGFDKRPKLGMLIMRVEIFSGQGKKDTSFEVRADSGMPSMSGAHETGEQTFNISNKGVYLHPINIVMPGDWEIRMTVLKQGKIIFRGRYNFDV